MVMHKIPLSSMMVPNQNPVVFVVRLLRGHACPGQRVLMYVAEPAHVLEPTTVVHFLRLSQRHLIGLCCTFSFPDMLSEISCHQPDLNLRQI